MRTVAALLLLVAGSACDRRAAAPAVQPFTITRGAACLVEYACAPGQACPAPYEYDCGFKMWPDGFSASDAVPFARLGDTCYVREHGCATASCLTRTWSCPPPPSKTPLPTVAWTVVQTASGCTATPQPRGRLTPTPPAFGVACEPAYAAGATEVRLDTTTGACAIPDQPCPEGSHCEPGEDTPVPCPARSAR